MKAWRRSASISGGHAASRSKLQIVGAGLFDENTIQVDLSGPLPGNVSDPTGWSDPELDVPSLLVGASGSSFVLITVNDAGVTGDITYDGTGGCAAFIAAGTVPYT